MGKKYHVQKREFLNLKTDMRAYVIAMVEDSSDLHVCCGNKENNQSEVILEIASCYREIELQFGMETVVERENSLYKANKLAEVVNAFRDAIEKEIGIVNERQSTQQHTRAASAVH